MRTRFTILATAGFVWCLAGATGAYSLMGVRWTSGSSIVMHLEQGSSSGSLSDGSADWDAVTDGALSTWNSVLSSVSFRSVRDSLTPALHNGVNNVAFANDMFGDAFGDAIAVTFSTSRGSSFQETDVLFDRNRSWNSYRGNLQRGSSGTVFDLRRVALHEFGHVLGLDHPDQAGQSVAAVMNSRVSNTDSLQTDDINGVHAIYGGSAGTPSAPSAPSTPSNRAPTAGASCDPCTVEAELTSTLRASASDPDGDPLSYSWSAPQGTFSSSASSEAVWTAPNTPQDVTATVTVRDNRGGSATATVALHVIARDTLKPNTKLTNGQSLISANLRYRLAYQGDGNLVLYDENEKKALWASNTGGTNPREVSMQSDGNLVVYDAAGKPHWSTGTVGNGNAYLLVQNDGNLVLYSASGQPLWDRSKVIAPTSRRRLTF